MVALNKSGLHFLVKKIMFVHSMNVKLVIKAVGANVNVLRRWFAIKSTAHTVPAWSLNYFEQQLTANFLPRLRKEKCQPFNLLPDTQCPLL